ncbi:sulfite exporter TauE/SafE family protein [Lewinella sp. IMCC34191]|uniref:sulfite exporter TauE/SafE family protein n=1 Tax=Lewinella sp. IMCC34191 TaxID=2259172 RepID=UPI001E341250|nr:sulfite exporter TauE/SafE family protein [Lewinella sp. IMCC34191]
MILEYTLALVGSLLAGGINTLSGNGSAITLTILMEVLGLPGTVANATNRVGIVTQSMAGTWAFHRAGRLKLSPVRQREMWTIVIVSTLGAIVGIWLSLVVDNATYRSIFRYLLFVMLLVVLVNPKRWLREAQAEKSLSLWIGIPAFFALGIYGGFIQMGMGIFFLALMVLVAKYEIIQANVVKGIVVLIYTSVAVLIFAWQGVIDWRFGLLMAVGQTVGGYLTARYAANHPKAGVWSYRLLVVVIVAAIAKAFWPF